MPAIGVAALVLGGCASTRHEAKPEVALQPQATSAEAVVAAAAPPAPKPVLQRFRPADRSVRDIREQSAATAPPLDFGQRLDHSHDQLYAWMQGIVDATDRGLASDNRQVQPVPAAPFRIGLSLETIDRSGAPAQVEGELEMALQLPNMRSRLRIFITSDDPDESPRGPGQKAYLSAGLRRELLRDVNFDLGIRLDAPPVAFSSIKWSREIPLGGLSFYPLAKVFVESGRGFGASVAATFDHWSGRTLLRSSTYARWIADGDRGLVAVTGVCASA
jgi:hypothetical protein